jgi:hypothetical protein
MVEAPRARRRGENADDALALFRAALHTPKGRVWLGVSMDVFLTILLASLGWAPMLEAVRAQKYLAACVLGALHIVLVPIVFFIGTNDKAVVDSGVPPADQPWADKIAGYAFFGFYIMGWLLPVCAYAIALVPKWLFMATVFTHIAPVAFLFVGVLCVAVFGKKVDQAIDGAIRATMRVLTIPVLTVIFALYLALVEAFLLLVRTRYGDLGEMAFPAWAISYVPARLFFARITGLQGPERWTFLAANVHLVVRMALTHPHAASG